TANVGSLIAVIADEGEDISALVAEFGGGGAAEAAPEEPAAAPPPAQPGAPEKAEQPQAEAAPAGSPAAQAVAEAPAGGDGRRRASPVARRLAAESGLELGAVAGSGPGGRIIKRDVEAALEGGVPAAAPAEEAAAPAEEAPAPVATVSAEATDVPLSQM